jgi:plasmid segregation protein ParM
MAKSFIMGVDVGYSHTKTVSGKKKDVFRSTVKEGVIDVNVGSTIIDIDGKELTIGERGSHIVDENKINDPRFEALLVSAILRNVDEKLRSYSINLVTGLPIAWYKSQKDALRDFLYNKEIVVGYKGKDRTIHIEDCIVFPQSAGLVLTNPKSFDGDSTNIVIDIGGITVDVAYYEGRKLVEYKSYQKGMLKFYSTVAGEINNQFNVDVDEVQAERFIERNKVTINGDRKAFDFDSLFKGHLDDIMTKVKTDFSYKITDSVTFMGGGSLRFKKYLPDIAKDGIECDELFGNAEAFYNVGVSKFAEVR